MFVIKKNIRSVFLIRLEMLRRPELQLAGGGRMKAALINAGSRLQGRKVLLPLTEKLTERPGEHTPAAGRTSHELA